MKIDTNAIKNVLKEHLPDILMVVGGTCVVGGAVMSAIRTPKMRLALEEFKKNKYSIEEAKQYVLEGKEIDYSIADYRSDLAGNYIRFCKDFIKVYSPAILLEMAGLTMMFSGYGIMKVRYGVAMMSLSVAESTIERLESEKENEGTSSYDKHDMEDIAEEVKTVKNVNFKGEELSPYARCFDEFNSRVWNRSNILNREFIEGVESRMTDRLRSSPEGVLFLNEVYEALGMERTAIGAIAGWSMNKGDNYVSFSRGKDGMERQRDFFAGIGAAVWLDFNCCGSILDQI